MSIDRRRPEELLAEAGRLAALAEERTRQYTREDLAGMSPEAIVEARARGQLDELLGIHPATD